jgi:phage terminase Nu1 subunit (DNA packaging protein)
MVTKENRLKLALETGFSLRTIEKWSQGKPVSESTDRALLKAASELGLAPENTDPEAS